MPDNLQNRGQPDRSRVNVNEDYEVQYWTKKFGVTKDQLRAAVQAVGNDVQAVAQYLGKAA